MIFALNVYSYNLEGCNVYLLVSIQLTTHTLPRPLTIDRVSPFIVHLDVGRMQLSLLTLGQGVDLEGREGGREGGQKGRVRNLKTVQICRS